MEDLFSKLRAELLDLAKREGGPMFHSKPDRWWDSPTWRCTNDHVSHRYLKTEMSGDVCLACFEPILLTFPEDKDGPLRR